MKKKECAVLDVAESCTDCKEDKEYLAEAIVKPQEIKGFVSEAKV